MKSTIISMLIVLVILTIVPILYFGDEMFANFMGSDKTGPVSKIEEMKEVAPKNFKSVVTDKKIEVYKWVDEHGVTQFSNTPPPDGGESSLLRLSPDTNVMKPVAITEKEEEVSKAKIMSTGNPYDPENMKDMINQSQDLQEVLDQRQADQNKVLESLLKQQK